MSVSIFKLLRTILDATIQTVIFSKKITGSIGFHIDEFSLITFKMVNFPIIYFTNINEKFLI